ncbi:hypothetical protein HanRHA438_Chr04g0176191 [Helianthus annuus]|nr:hypothetical protein HanPI659440_Chr04g0162121 [Helianthus annuus]KAJ0926862.1 hypothetical protein HanRHA438_Chr04g0176191 [Helianthus annuus]
MGFMILGTTSRSVMNFFIQAASFAASDATMYSDSVVESATTLCLELFHETAPPLRVNTKPVCEREVSRSV